MMIVPRKLHFKGSSPEGFVRRSETTAFRHPSETTEFHHKGREYAMFDILDIPLPAIYARTSKRRIQRAGQ